MDSQQAALAFMDAAQRILDAIRTTQMDKIEQSAQICANSIGQDGLVHLFGTGHSRIPVEEMFPRHGSFPGFHPIIDLSMTFHTQVVGSNGQRQAMLIEKMEGLGEAILRNFVFRTYDSFMIFSNSGVNNVIMDVAIGAKERGMKVIGIVSVEHCLATAPRHKSGLRLPDVCDITIDNCTPSGDALVEIEGLEYPVGPGSTIGYTAIVNALKCAVAQKLTAMGKPPLVLTSGVLIGGEKSAELFERTYDDFRDRVKQVYGG
ncbi:MAG: SIS domain-containing protein [Anaerolineae bacterium]|nr:SIS domain-containing protein [Anaerolineae bacterium]